mmetsp:Transcript_34150/g.59653  ORF Transcript_34150/g.59653 Transcript_34150/m.59653 type:complete len:138 (+) Transcript_34150:90-503(+)
MEFSPRVHITRRAAPMMKSIQVNKVSIGNFSCAPSPKAKPTYGHDVTNPFHTQLINAKSAKASRRNLSEIFVSPPLASSGVSSTNRYSRSNGLRGMHRMPSAGGFITMSKLRPARKLYREASLRFVYSGDLRIMSLK